MNNKKMCIYDIDRQNEDQTITGIYIYMEERERACMNVQEHRARLSCNVHSSQIEK